MQNTQSHVTIDGGISLQEAISGIRGPRPAHTATACEILDAAVALVEEVGAENGSVANSDTVSKIGLMYCQGQLR